MPTTYRADLEEKNARRANRRGMAIGASVGVILGLLILAAIGLWHSLFHDLPDIGDGDRVWTANRDVSLEFLDTNGQTLAQRGPRYGRRVAVDDLPPHVLQAFLAVEDARFFDHPGVDFWSIGRAVVENLSAGGVVQGGSTITQQLVKTVYLTPEQTFRRKLQEAVLAWQIDRRLTKTEILEVYLNRIYFGQNAYGLDAAARRFFSKSPMDLSLSEAALLAGLPKAPARLAQDITAAPAVSRRAIVLQRMVDAGFLGQRRAMAAASEPVMAKTMPSPREGETAYVFDMAAAELAAIERLTGEALPPDRIVRLTIDPMLQDKAVSTVQAFLASRGGRARASQAALVAMDRRGRILALVGGRTYEESQFNRATQARRQPGSTFKPFVYAAALEAGLSPSTIRVDRPVRFGRWRPRNFGGGYSGSMSLNSALTRSINTIPVQLTEEVGIDRVRTLASRLGINSPLPNNLTIALGSGEVTLLELTRAYATLANDGVRIDPHVVAQVDTTRQSIAYSRENSRPVQVFEPLRARQMTAMLANVVSFGTGRRARLPDGRDVAGKTGTSQNFRDAWFVGYTGDIIAGVWVGNDQPRAMRGVTGGTLPAMIWSDFMAGAHEGLPKTPLPTLAELNRPTTSTIATFYDSLASLLEIAATPPLAPTTSGGRDRPSGLDQPAPVVVGR